MKLRKVALLAGFAIGYLWTRNKLAGRKEHRFIDFNKLLPGDIILTRPREKDSKIIAGASGGPFSHAQIVLDRFDVLESTYDEGYAGVREHHYLSIYVNRKPVDRKPRRKIQAYDIGEYKSFEVFRYVPKSPAEIERLETFRATLRQKTEDYYGYPYASAKTLTELSPLLGSESLRMLAEEIIASRVPQPAFEGLYCSQLVLLLYEEAGIPLVETPAIKARVTPNDLCQIDRLSCVTSEAVVDLTAREFLVLKLVWRWFEYHQVALQRFNEGMAQSWRRHQKRRVWERLGLGTGDVGALDDFLDDNTNIPRSQ